MKITVSSHWPSSATGHNMTAPTLPVVVSVLLYFPFSIETNFCPTFFWGDYLVCKSQQLYPFVLTMAFTVSDGGMEGCKASNFA